MGGEFLLPLLRATDPCKNESAYCSLRRAVLGQNS
jgi:hypothetical protein